MFCLIPRSSRHRAANYCRTFALPTKLHVIRIKIPSQLPSAAAWGNIQAKKKEKSTIRRGHSCKSYLRLSRLAKSITVTGKLSRRLSTSVCSFGESRDQSRQAERQVGFGISHGLLATELSRLCDEFHGEIVKYSWYCLGGCVGRFWFIVCDIENLYHIVGELKMTFFSATPLEICSS